MKKISLIMVLIGVLILAGIFYFLNKDNSSTSNTQSTQNQTNNQASGPTEVVVNYDSTKAFGPQTAKVEQGRQVVLKVTSNVADELHFHGYDLHIDLESGQEGQIAFIADKTGRFEFELEDHKITLGVIEVNPK